MKTFRSLVSKHFPSGTNLGEMLTHMTKKNMALLTDAAAKGAVWVQKGKGKTLRERKLGQKLAPQDTVIFFFDPKVLSLPAITEAQCLMENEQYGIWFKEAGVLPQGTQAGDHASLLRYIEVLKKKEIHLVHRLDRETAGLMLFAYSKEAAAKLSLLFQKNLIKKTYEAIVLGELKLGHQETINASLDDKEAITHLEVKESQNGQSLLLVEIETGRLHQIRRHLDHIGHPVMGDPKYGRGNKNKEGLKLLAKSLSFQDPWNKKSITCSSPSRLSL